jgi:hypothetical protein
MHDDDDDDDGRPGNGYSSAEIFTYFKHMNPFKYSNAAQFLLKMQNQAIRRFP